MRDVVFFDTITVALPEKAIDQRLGRSHETLTLASDFSEKLEIYIQESLEYIHLSGCALRIPVAEITKNHILLEENYKFVSQDLGVFLADAKEVLLMGATAGKQVIDAIQQKTSSDDLTRAVVYDAVASEMTDEALSWIMNYFNRDLVRENLYLDQRRFSAGYGDFAIKYQKIIWELLNMKKIEVSLTDNFLFIPEKSVTAIAGIRTVK